MASKAAAKGSQAKTATKRKFFQQQPKKNSTKIARLFGRFCVVCHCNLASFSQNYSSFRCLSLFSDSLKPPLAHLAVWLVQHVLNLIISEQKTKKATDKALSAKKKVVKGGLLKRQKKVRPEGVRAAQPGFGLGPHHGALPPAEDPCAAAHAEVPAQVGAGAQQARLLRDHQAPAYH